MERLNILLPACTLLCKIFQLNNGLYYPQPSVLLQILSRQHFLALSTLLDSFVISVGFSAVLLLCRLAGFIIYHILSFRLWVLFWFWLSGVLAGNCYKIQEIWKLCRWQIECCVLSFMMGFRLFYNRWENCQLLFPVPTFDIFRRDCGIDMQG